MNTKKEGNSTLLSLLFQKLGLIFSRNEMEKAYKTFKQDFNMHLAVLLNIVQTGVVIYFAIIDFIIIPNTVITKATDATTIAVLLILLVIRKRIMKIYPYLIVAICNFITIRDGTIIKTVVFGIEDAFILGNLHGIILSCSLLTLKQTNIRTLFHIIVLVFRIVTLQWIFPVIDSAVLFLFYAKEDILERKKFQKIYESQENLRQFESLLSQEFPLSMFVLDSDLQSLIYVNSTFMNNFLEPPSPELFADFIIEKKYFQETWSGHLESSNQETFSLQEMLKNPDFISVKLSSESGTKLSTYFPHQNGTQRHYEILINKITWKLKTAYAFILQDVTEKDAIMQLKIADEQKDKVLATVSHELRTPLNGSLGILALIKDKIPSAEKEIHELLQNCQSCNRLLLYLVNSILDLTQIRQNSLKIIKKMLNLQEVIEEINSLYKFQSTQKSVQFEVKMANNLPQKIYTDKFRLIQILINLIGNALKFTFNGSVILKVKSDRMASSHLRFSIQDTGIGIKDEDKDKLFKMFGKLDHKGKNINSQGVGLGLTICNELVRALNDNHPSSAISWKSEFGKGSKFSFSIPVIETVTTSSRSPLGQMRTVILSEDLAEIDIPKFLPFFNKNQFNSSKGSQKVKRLRVLCVDDNPFNLYVLINYLKKIQVEIFQAFNGRESIEIVEKEAKAGVFFDLIFMDIQMPVMDGFEASKILKEKMNLGEIKSVPIVALTASSTKEINGYKEHSKNEVGIVDIVEKPIKEKDLQRVFNTYIYN